MQTDYSISSLALELVTIVLLIRSALISFKGLCVESRLYFPETKWKGVRMWVRACVCPAEMTIQTV